MKWILLLALVLLPQLVGAQIIAIDLNRAQLQWQWVQGTGGLVAEFHVKCGSATGNYTKVTVLVGSAVRATPIKDVITGSGNWFCTVSAVNQYGESANANEVNFAAGATPSSPTSVTVTAQ